MQIWLDKINAYLAGIFILLVLGIVYHRDPAFAGSALGHGMGIAGTVLIFMALIYPFRKRVLKKKGRQNPLESHVAYGLLGPSLVVIHSAHKITSLIGTLIFLVLLLLVLTGIIGRFLFRRVNRSLREQKRDHKLLRGRFDTRKKEMGEICATPLSNGTEEPDDVALENECRRWMDEAWALADVEYSIKFFDRLKRLFSRWIQTHYLLATLLFALVAVHVTISFYYGIRWLP